MKPFMLMDEKDAANAKALAEIFRTAPCAVFADGIQARGYFIFIAHPVVSDAFTPQ